MNNILAIRSIPAASLLISKIRVFIGVGVIALLLTTGILLRRSHRTEKPVEQTVTIPSPGAMISSLPASYEDRIVQNVSPTPIIKIIERPVVAPEIDTERLKRALEARRSSVTFASFNQAAETHPERTTDITTDSNSQGLSNHPRDSRDNPNGQQSKESFLAKKGSSDVSLHEALIKPSSPYQLLAGTVIPGLLLTGINSDLPGQLLGQVSQNVYDSVSGNSLLIPQGTKIVGQYDSNVVYGQQRVLIVWERLLFPNGQSISLERMQGIDMSGYAGLSDSVNNHYLRLLSGVVLSSLLSASAQIAQGRNYATFNPSYDQLAAQGVAQNVNDVGQQITQRNLNVQPTLEVRPGFKFQVFVNKDVTLTPYL